MTPFSAAGALRRFIVPLLALVASASCQAGDDPLQPEPVASTDQALTGLTHPINCGFNNGRTCESLSPLGNNVTDSATWDPCLGGAFTWTATANFEQNYDRFCVGGTATAGDYGGCSSGTQLNGSGAWSGSASGPITVSLATDVSNESPGLSSLVATCNEPLYTAVFRKGTGVVPTLELNLLWTDFINAWTANSGAGKRLQKVRITYDSTGAARFDGYYVPGTGGYGFNAGLSWAQVQSQAATNATNGLQLTDLEVQQTGSGVVFTGVWNQGTDVQVLYNGSVANFWNWVANYTSEGYQPTSVRIYHDANGVASYAAVMTYTPGQSGWVAAVGVPYVNFARSWRQNQAAGWQLSLFNSNVVGGVRYYDGWFVPGSSPAADFVAGSRTAQLQAAVAAYASQGYDLVDLGRYTLENTTSDKLGESQQDNTDYPVIAPAWLAEADNFFTNTVGGPAMGYTVAAMKDGKLLGATSVGNAAAYQNNSSPTVPMTPDAQWDWFSVTKAVTGIAALKVADAKQISLNTPIMPYISSNFPTSVIGAPGTTAFWNITLYNALTHTSDLFDGGCDGGPGTWESGLSFQPGGAGIGTFNYSGYDACMLRLFVEKETGTDLPTYLDDNIFRPMGIHNLDCIKDTEKVQVLAYNQAPNYYSNGTFPYTEPNIWCADSGVKGSVFEFLKFFQGLRQSGVLSAGVLNTLRTNNMNFGLNFTNGYNGFATVGQRYGETTGCAQFPATQDGQPGVSGFSSSVYPYYSSEASYGTGVDAVFWTNSGMMGTGEVPTWIDLFQMAALDPVPY